MARKQLKISMLNVETDAVGVLEVYRPYIQNTPVTFEVNVPDLLQFEQRLIEITIKFPYLICVDEDSIVGYAYACEQRQRSAYQLNADMSIYLKQEYQGRSIGKALYAALLDILSLQKIQNVYVGITLPNTASEKLHQYFGFSLLGINRNTGFKLGQWHSVAWYEKSIGNHEPDPQKPIAIDRISQKEIKEILVRNTEKLNRSQSYLL